LTVIKFSLSVVKQIVRIHIRRLKQSSGIIQILKNQMINIKREQQNSDNRTLGIVNSIHKDKGYAFISPLELQSTDFIFLHANEMCEEDWDKLQIGSWAMFEIKQKTKGPAAILVELYFPTEKEKMKRQLGSYGSTPSMARGVNPRSQRLDGLTQHEAKHMHRRGAMTSKEYYLHMSENGLQSAARYFGSDYKTGDREANVRRILESIRDSHENKRN
jgi:cold shock CspA family protein